MLCLLSLLFTFLFSTPKPADNALKLKLKSIFKKHGDRLVSLVDEEFINSTQLVYIKDFEDLVRIADDVCRPIFYRCKDASNDIYTFCVLDERYIYVLQLSEANEEAVTLDNNASQPKMFIRY